MVKDFLQAEEKLFQMDMWIYESANIDKHVDGIFL